MSLVAGFKLDISTASYFAVIPFLTCILLIFGFDTATKKFIKTYNFILIFIVIILSVSNIIIYKFWGTLLNNRGLAYALQPKEMLASVTGLQLFFLVVILIFLTFIFFKLHSKITHRKWNEIQGTTLHRAFSLLIMLPIIGIGIRGGLQLIPVNESSAYYSNHRLMNNIATNNIWYLGHNLKQAGLSEKNPYVWMEDETAEQIKNTLYNPTASSHQIFDTSQKPNVVILLLESWTADIIEPLGGEKGVTPFFTKLSEQGMLFTSVYSSGFRTDQALVSVISGFPAQPNNSIIRFPSKTASLPSLATSFKNEGYKTSFYYGGELGFANMNSYLISAGFEKITGEDAFESNSMNSKWGAHDGFVLSKQIKDLKLSPQPFFSLLLTLSTHEPFEVPIATPFNGTSEPELFKKAAWYTDKSLEEYFEVAKKENWFQNTIFILVADHGHRLPLNRDYYDPAIRKIPMLIYSPLLKKELIGTKIKSTANQNDLAATLLNNLGMASSQFEWSSNILANSRRNFAYLSLDEAFTWITDSSVTTLKFDDPNNATQNTSMEAKAYMQQLYHRFITY